MSKTFEAGQIEVGYHSDGYRIDRTATPMNRYTTWQITPDGSWVDPKPVCFDSMPQQGWLKAEKFDWDVAQSDER